MLLLWSKCNIKYYASRCSTNAANLRLFCVTNIRMVRHTQHAAMSKNARITARLTEGDEKIMKELRGEGYNSDTELIETALRLLHLRTGGCPRKARRIAAKFRPAGA